MRQLTQAQAQAVRFLSVGIVNTLVAFVTFHAVLGALHRARGAPAVAQTIATLLAMTCSYLLNRAWTFRSQRSRGPELVRFIASQAALLALTSALLEIAIDGLHFPPVISWLGVTATLTLLNFVGQRYWVFRAPDRVLESR